MISSSVAASRDAIIRAGDKITAGAISAGRDVAIKATNDATLSSITAGDDIVLRAGKVDGACRHQRRRHRRDRRRRRLVAEVGAVTLEGTSFDLTGSDIDIKAGQITTTALLTAAGTTSDVRINGTGALDLAGVKAGQDVLIDGASTVAAGDLDAGRDVGLRSTGAGSTVTLASAKAGDDLVIRAKGDITVTGTLTATGGTDSAAADQAGDLMFGAAKTALNGDLDLTGKTVDLGSSTGSITVAGAIAADGDARLQTTATTGGSVKVAAITAGQNILLDGGTGAGANGVEATGTLTATNGDIAVRARDGKTVTLAALVAGDDVALRTTGAVNVSGTVTTGAGTDSAGLADRLVADAGAVTLEGTSFDLTGSDIDIKAGQVTTTALLTAAGTTSDVRINGTGALDLAGVKAGQDVLIDGASTVAAGDLDAGRDVGLRSTGAGSTVTLASGKAGDDLVIRAKGDITVTGTLSATGGTDAVGAGDLLFGAAKTALNGDLDLTGKTVDLSSSAGSITVADAIDAAGDARIQTTATTGGSVKVAAITAGQNILLDGGTGAGANGVEATGTLTATNGDIAVRARDGKAVTLAALVAGDDVALRTTGAVGVSGTITTGAGTDSAGLADRLVAEVGAVTLEGTSFDLTGSDIDIKAGQITTTALLTAAGTTSDVRINGTGALDIAGVKAGQDVLIDGASTVAAGDLEAGRDLGLRSTGAAVTLASAKAGDDLVLRSPTSIQATGDIKAGQTAASGDPDTAGVADTLMGATMTGHDLDIKAQTVLIAGDVAAGRAPVSGETLGAAQLASDILVVATGADAGATAAMRLATASGKTVKAHQDIDLRADSVAGGSVQTAGLEAGRDIAVYSVAKNITLGSAVAGDDIALRAPVGAVEVTGDVKAGRDFDGMTSVDGVGAADALQSALMFKDFDANPATVFSMVGFDVNIASQSIQRSTVVATAAGRQQPASTSPDVAGAVDTSTSDVRLQTLVSLTPTTGLAPDIKVGAVTATRDIQIDSAKAVLAGDLKAGRDVAILGRGNETPGAAVGDHSGAGVTIASIRAGDDALAYSIFGRAKITGSVTANAPFARLAPSTDTTIDGATQAADQLAIYLHYLDLDEVSRNYVLNGGDIQIVGQGVEIGGALTANGANSDIRLQSSLDIVATGLANAGGDLQFDAATTLTAGGLTAGRDIALVARGGALVLDSGSAGDDLVLRGIGAITVNGNLTATGGTDAAGAADLLFGAAKTALNGDLDLTGKTVDLSSSAGSITVAGAIDADGDARLQTTATTGGSIKVAAITAGQNILLDGGTGAGANGVEATGTLTATNGDIAVRARDGKAVSLAALVAGDDVALRTTGAVGVSGTVTTGAGTDSAGLADRLVAEVGAVTLEGTSFDLTGSDIDIKAGQITTTALLTAAGTASDVRISGTGALDLAGVKAGQDVLIDGASTVAAGDLEAGRDVGLRSTGAGAAVTLASAEAGDDLVLRAKGDITVTGTLTATGGTDSAAADQAGDLMFGAAKTALNGDLDLTGKTVDVSSSAGSITVAGAIDADGDARIQTTATTGGSVKVAAITAGQNILLDGGTGAGANGVEATGTLTATNGDIAVRARDGKTATLAALVAGDDVALRTSGAVNVSGTITTGAGTDSAGMADRLVAEVGAVTLEGTSFDLTGADIDIKAGQITTTALLTAAGTTSDVRINGTGALDLAGVKAGQDVLIDGASTVAAGDLEAGRDVGLRSTGAGAAVTLASAEAGDDLVLRAKGDITVTGTLTATGGTDSAAADQAGDLMFGAAKTALNGDLDLTGKTVDVSSSAGSITVAGAIDADGDARIQTTATTGGSVKVAAITAGQNILLDGGTGAGANGVEATGTLTATNGDIAVRARDGKTATLAALVAGDDVALRTSGAVNVSGTITTGAGTDSAGMADRLVAEVGAVTLEGTSFDLTGADIDIKAGQITTTALLTAAGTTSDVRINGTGALDLAGVKAGQDVLIDGASTVAAGDLEAGRDVGLRSTGAGAAVTLASAKAGDDLVIRAKGDITVTGTLTATGGTDSAAADQAGDLMFGVAKTALNGDLDLTGKTVDLGSTAGSITVAGAVAADGDARIQTTATTGGSIKVAAITAGQNILLDGGTGAGANGVEATGTLTASNGDIAVRARDGKAVALAALVAGDDVALRTTGAVGVSGTITTGAGTDSAGMADRLISSVESGAMVVEGTRFDLAGSNIDIIGDSVTLGAATARNAVRIQANGGVSIGDTSAGTDVLIDGGGTVSASALTAGGDIGVRSRNGGLTAGSARANDDVVLRASQSITSGQLIAGSSETNGAGDLLANADATELGGAFGLSGGNVDVLSHSGSITLSSAEATTDVRVTASNGGVSASGALKAGRDILLDGASVTASGDLQAGADVAIYGRTGGVTLTSATAGDDIAIRAAGAVSVSGALKAGQSGDSSGAADRLISAAGQVTLAGTTFDLTGGAIDVRGAGITLNGDTTADGYQGPGASAIQRGRQRGEDHRNRRRPDRRGRQYQGRGAVRRTGCRPALDRGRRSGRLGDRRRRSRDPRGQDHHSDRGHDRHRRRR